jgi:hypothetical protein
LVEETEMNFAPTKFGFAAPEARQTVAHGVNRGKKAKRFQAPDEAKEGAHGYNGFVLSLLWSLYIFVSQPTAVAVGYYLSPLRGFKND